MPSFPWRKISFPTLCVLRVTQYLKVISWSSFFSCNFPWGCERREMTHTHSKRQTNIQTSVPSCFLHRRDPVNLGMSGKFLDPWVWTCIMDFGGNIYIFLLVGPKAMRPSNCLKIHPIAVLLLLSVLTLLHPLGFLRQSWGLQLLAGGRLAVQCHLD